MPGYAKLCVYDISHLQLLNRPFDLYEHNKMALRTDADIQDVVTIVDGLIDVSFKNLCVLVVQNY